MPSASQKVLLIKRPLDQGLSLIHILLLILNCGSLLNVGMDKVYLMQNTMNLSVSEVISTYVYKVGLLTAQYSYSTAIGLFNAVINFMILFAVDRFAKKASGISLF